MRKLKQASQREKARKALKQRTDAETTQPGPRARNGSTQPKQNGKSGHEHDHGGGLPAEQRSKFALH